jgi:hypothetical protein
MANKLTPKQEKFVQGLFKGLSQRKAYKEAFDTSNLQDNTIDVVACNLAKDNKIAIRLKELTNLQARETGWTVDKLIKEFEEVKGMCKVEIPVLDRQGVPTGEYKFDSVGAVKSLENIGKLLGMYKEKMELSGEVVIFKGDEKLED